jgi:hypothetical protein
MKKTTFSALAMVFAFSSTMALGAITTDQLIAEYQTNGYSYIEVKSGLSQIKVEAVKDGKRIEVIYDIATGAPIKTSTYSVGTIVTPDPGVRLRNTNRDFSRSDSNDRDDDSDDRDGYEKHSGQSDDHSRGGDDNRSYGSDDDHNDDRDHDRNDDHGNDDHDDHGDDHDD